VNGGNFQVNDGGSHRWGWERVGCGELLHREHREVVYIEWRLGERVSWGDRKI
jgi:hypothetical protein